MKKKIFISLVFSILINVTFSQHAELIKKKQDLKNRSYIALFINSNECANCFMFLNDAINISKNVGMNDNDIIIVTNNYSYAKKFCKKSKLNSEIFVDQKIFNTPQINHYNSIFIHSKTNKEFVYNKKNYKSHLYKESLKLAYSNFSFPPKYQYNDSLLSQTPFYSGMMNFGALILDSDLQNLHYLFPDTLINRIVEFEFSNSQIFYKLPDRVNKEKYSLLPSDEANAVYSEHGLEKVHVNSISSIDSTFFCFFTLNKIYYEAESSNISVFSTYFIGTKKVNTILDFELLNDLSKYDHIYYVDSFSYLGSTYPLGPWINDYAIVLNDTILKIKVNYENAEKRKIEFGGLATIQLNPNSNNVKLLEIDKTAKPQIEVIEISKYNGYKYRIRKEFTNEEKNHGIIYIEKVD